MGMFDLFCVLDLKLLESNIIQKFTKLQKEQNEELGKLINILF